MTSWRGAKNIGLWGYGREGRASHRFLAQACPLARFTVLSDTPTASLPEGLEALDGDAARRAIADGTFDWLVKSPGVSLYRPEVARALENGSRLTSGTNLWFDAHSDARKVVVTGTKGKTTTSSVLFFMLERMGLDVALGGNIGVPLLDLEPGRDVTVIEMSSAQIADLATPPDLAIVINLFPEHMDWHGSVERYFDDKTRLLSLEPPCAGVLNAADARLVRRFEGRKNTRWFNHPEGFSVESGALTLGGEAIPFSWPLKGAHNTANLAAVLTAIESLGYDPRAALDALPEFRPPQHRLQELGTRGGLLFVNDSISTTPQSTMAAVNVYAARPIALILGGFDRGQDYSGLASDLAGITDLRVFTLPDSGPRIAEALRADAPGLPVDECEDLEDAVRHAQAALDSGVVLLSPAAPSFGRFRDYRARGEAFAALAGLPIEQADGPSRSQ